MYNVDASRAPSSTSRFVGAVVRDSDGMFVTTGRYSLHASFVAVAKAMAILKGNVLTNGSWEAFHALIKSKKLGESFQDCRWSWIPRSANMAANHLASRQCWEMCDYTWVDWPPSSLVHVLNNDRLPCPP
ncbi:hypothetical protein DVH24_031596 [Malus domestica]|uniref:RNase H type-1 domain-containing protein n=1 Tax=Malus domestica TaxID=3750 RepID=A0A498J0K2_MALDO|nr:hypothetical protein DVH24_031596 [Malus domestica]